MLTAILLRTAPNTALHDHKRRIQFQGTVFWWVICPDLPCAHLEAPFLSGLVHLAPVLKTASPDSHQRWQQLHSCQYPLSYILCLLLFASAQPLKGGTEF